jgi:hypothetical protein
LDIVMVGDSPAKSLGASDNIPTRSTARLTNQNERTFSLVLIIKVLQMLSVKVSMCTTDTLKWVFQGKRYRIE